MKVISLCLHISTVTEWFVLIITKKLKIFIQCYTFLTTHISVVIFSSIDQWFLSAAVRNLLKNIIDSTCVVSDTMLFDIFF